MSPTLLVLRVATPAALFVAVAGVFYFLLSASNAVSPRLGMRGLARSRALHTSPLWAEIEPLVRWLGLRVEPLLGKRLRERMDWQIVLSGDFWGLVPGELAVLTALSSTVCAFVGAGVALGLEKQPTLYGMLGCALGALVPYLQLTNLQEARKKRVQNGLPCVIDLLSLALSAGLDFPGALRQVVQKSSNPADPLIEEINLILYELSVGKTRKQALAQFAERMPFESVREFVAAVVQAEERGSPLDEVLRIQAESSRERRSVRAEEAAARAGVKMFGPILIIFSVVMMLILVPLLMGLQQTFSGD